MATYLEVRSLFGESELIKKVMVAAIISAEKISSGNDDVPPFDQTAGMHDNRVRWAANAITDTAQESDRLLKVVLAANADLTLAQIEGATDAAIQSNVDAAVDLIATALFTGV
jgi:hypothetical protein